MPRNATINYQRLTINTVKTKFTSFILGLFVFLIIVSTFSMLFFVRYSYIFTQKVAKKSENGKVLSQQAVKQKTYTVQEGDDLWKISEKVYGSGYNGYDIAKANNITDPNLLVAGQILKIPEITPQPPTVGETSSISTTKVTFTGKYYTVKAGDDLGKIAEAVYGDPEAWKRIVEANKLIDPNSIHEGNVLIIPR